MKFAVGYQLAAPGEESFANLIAPWREHVAEVYFPWIGAPSGRSAIGVRGGELEPWAFDQFERDLLAFREMGLGLDLLLNANCYGPTGMSRKLESAVGEAMDDLAGLVGGVEVVTTTSPAIAHILRKHWSAVRVRASVNMRLGTVTALSQMAALFDSFYVQRDYNRDLVRLHDLKAWADRNGKGLCMLANSGCIRFCAGQTFHDNLVAHEAEAAVEDNLPGFMPYTCWRLLKDRANWPLVLQATWVRPEDLHHYEGLFEVVKLATRMHDRPAAVLRAYAEGRYVGNLLDLLEPGYSQALAPYVIDNRKIPADFFAHTTACAGQCHTCDYCRHVLDHALTRLELPGT